MDQMTEIFGEVISSYSRAQAIEDGVLIDLNQFIPVNESGYKWPIVCTAAVWSIIQKSCRSKTACYDVRGIVHDIFWMSRKAVTKQWTTGAMFRVMISRRWHDFKIECSGGDNGEPVLTIMLPSED